MATPSKRRSLECEAVKKPPIVRKNFMSIDAYTRHKFLISHYKLSHPGSLSSLERDTSKDKTDADVLQQYHKFLWNDGEEEDQVDEEQEGTSGSKDEQWGKKLAKAYYDKLFKEYCISDLTFYKEKKVAMRWRTEKEVVEGKGQFICGEKHCDNRDGLKSWEVNFGYVEEGSKKNALVKLRLCSRCSKKLNYHHKKNEAKKKKKKVRDRDDDDVTDEESGKEEDEKSEGQDVGKSSSKKKRKSSFSKKKRNLEDYLSDLLD